VTLEDYTRISGSLTTGSGDDTVNLDTNSEINGNVALGDGNNSLTNQGTIGGTVTVGDGDDTIVNYATINNALALGEGNNSYTGKADSLLGGNLSAGSGNDTLTLEQGTSGTLTRINGNVDLGEGNNQVTLEDYTRISGSLTTGSGDDTLFLSGAPVVSNGVYLGAGDDSVTVAATGNMGFNLDLGGGGNSLVNQGTIGGTITVGNGADTVTNYATINSDLDLGEGNNSYTGKADSLLDANLSTGAGNDTLILEQGTSGTYTRINGDANLGDGNNQVTLEDYSRISGSLTTGPGNDTLDLAATAEITGSVDLGGGSDAITHRGSVGGDIYAGAGNDTVTLVGGHTLTGIANGGADIDTLAFNNMGAVNASQWGSKYINFENLAAAGSGTTSLTGAWDLGAGTVTVDGGTLNLPDTLAAGGMVVSSGIANIDGTVDINGNTTVDGTLNISTSGTLNTIDIALNPTGTLNVDGTLNVGGQLIQGGGGINIGPNGVMAFANLVVAGGCTLDITGLLTVTNSTTVNGTLCVHGGGTLTTGSITVNSPNTLVIAGTVNANTMNITSSGHVEINGVANITGTTIADGLLNINASGVLNTGNLAVGGTANIAGVANVAGLTSVSGTLNVTSSGALNTYTFTIASSGTANIAGTATVEGFTYVDGTLNLTGTGTLTTGGLNVGGTANIAGTANVEGDTNVSGSISVTGTLNTGGLYVGGYAYISGTVNTGYTHLSGTMNLAGLLNSPSMTIASGGFLYGTGTVVGDITNYGTISPGYSIGSLNVKGSATFQPGSIYIAEITSDGQSDQLLVSGSVTLNGGTLRTALPVALYTNGFSWPVITASGGVSGNFDSIDGQPESVVLYLTTVAHGTTLDLKVNRKSYTEFSQSQAAYGVGLGLDDIVPQAKANDDDMANLLKVMDWTFSAEEIATALDQMSPEMYDAFNAAALETTRVFTNALWLRSDQTRQQSAFGVTPPRAGGYQVAALAGDHPEAGKLPDQALDKRWTIWARALGSMAEQKGQGGGLGYDWAGGGAVFGADGKVCDWLTLGIGLGYVKNDLSWSRNSYDGSQESMMAGIYASAGLKGFYLDASLAYGSHDSDADRPIIFKDINGKASAGFDIETWMARLSGGYDWRLGSWLLGPTAGVSWLRLEQSGFSEGGAGFLNLGVDGISEDYFQTNLGLRVAGKWQTGELVWLPRFSLEWLHQFDADARALSAHFRDYTDAPFSVNGADPFENALTVQLGIGAVINDSFSAYLDYGLLWADDYTSHNLSVGLTWRF
jgi:fibronectin-binding autotransporter adhesin